MSTRSGASVAASSASQPFEVVGSDVEMGTPPKAGGPRSYDWLKGPGKGKAKAKDVAAESTKARGGAEQERYPMRIPEGAVLVRRGLVSSSRLY